MAGAIEKLSLFYGRGAKVDRGMMLDVLAGKGEASVFQLGDHVFGNRRGDALECIWSLLRAGEDGFAILGYLFSQWQKLIAAREIIGRGGSRKQVTEATGARFPLIDKLMRFTRTAAPIDPAYSSEAFARTDIDLKTGVDSLVAFSRLIFALTTE
jgi:DNA polymerase III delta subunit